MIGAMALLGSLGGLYKEQRNVWGAAIRHYVMGEATWRCSLPFLAFAVQQDDIIILMKRWSL